MRSGSARAHTCSFANAAGSGMAKQSNSSLFAARGRSFRSTRSSKTCTRSDTHGEQAIRTC